MGNENRKICRIFQTHNVDFHSLVNTVQWIWESSAEKRLSAHLGRKMKVQGREDEHLRSEGQVAAINS